MKKETKIDKNNKQQRMEGKLITEMRRRTQRRRERQQRRRVVERVREWGKKKRKWK
jgi:hypothetical protein